MGSLLLLRPISIWHVDNMYLLCTLDIGTQLTMTLSGWQHNFLMTGPDGWLVGEGTGWEGGGEGAIVL